MLAWVSVIPPEEPTVREKAAVCVAEAPVPVIVTLDVPVGVLELVVIVTVEDAPAVTELGLKLAVAPVGRPEAESATLCALPEVTAVETVAVAELPGVTVAAVGLTESEKSFVVEAGVSTTSSYSVYVGSPV